MYIVLINSTLRVSKVEAPLPRAHISRRKDLLNSRSKTPSAGVYAFVSAVLGV